MIYNRICGDSLSLLGFGAMRLPTTEDNKIDVEKTKAMFDSAIKNGVNYFDTAYPYHGGESEIVTGKLLSAYPRDSYYLATKYPGHQILDEYNPTEIFEEQLKKCGVEYFDYYLLHNVSESSINTYKDPKWGILEYFKKQKQNGRIRHLGFSTHGSVENIKEFLDYCGADMEFCQIQLNYLDWTLQQAKEKYELLTEYNIPVWVMEPVRGGKLANLKDSETELLRSLDTSYSPASWAFRFLQTLPNVKMVLSGMSDMEQLTDNLNTFESPKPLTESEFNTLLEMAEKMKNSVPCTACAYCVAGCPMELDIPRLLSLYNEMRFAPSMNISARVEGLPKGKQPSSCIGCSACVSICPQNIDIPKHLSDFTEALSKIPSWAEICRQRAEAAKKTKIKN